MTPLRLVRDLNFELFCFSVFFKRQERLFSVGNYASPLGRNLNFEHFGSCLVSTKREKKIPVK